MPRKYKKAGKEEIPDIDQRIYPNPYKISPRSTLRKAGEFLLDKNYGAAFFYANFSMLVGAEILANRPYKAGKREIIKYLDKAELVYDWAEREIQTDIVNNPIVREYFLKMNKKRKSISLGIAPQSDLHFIDLDKLDVIIAEHSEHMHLTRKLEDLYFPLETQMEIWDEKEKE